MGIFKEIHELRTVGSPEDCQALRGKLSVAISRGWVEQVPVMKPGSRRIQSVVMEYIDTYQYTNSGSTMNPTMKQSGSTPGLALATHNPVPKKEDSQAAKVTKRTREQLIDRLIGGACKVTGVRSKEAADRIIVQVTGGLVHPKPKGTNEQLIKAFAAIAEMAPQNATEAMLATQMIATNDAALMFLTRATLEDQHPEAIETMCSEQLA